VKNSDGEQLIEFVATNIPFSQAEMRMNKPAENLGGVWRGCVLAGVSVPLGWLTMRPSCPTTDLDAEARPIFLLTFPVFSHCGRIVGRLHIMRQLDQNSWIDIHR
jgi:hypothetical protein